MNKDLAGAWLDRHQAASYAHVSEHWIYQLIKTGKIKAEKRYLDTGHYGYVIEKESLDTYIQERKAHTDTGKYHKIKLTSQQYKRLLPHVLEVGATLEPMQKSRTK